MTAYRSVGTDLNYFPRGCTLIGMATKVQLWGYRCERCGHEWLPRNKDEAPRVCPKCKSPYWDRPRKKALDGGEQGKEKAEGDCAKQPTALPNEAVSDRPN